MTWHKVTPFEIRTRISTEEDVSCSVIHSMTEYNHSLWFIDYISAKDRLSNLEDNRKKWNFSMFKSWNIWNDQNPLNDEIYLRFEPQEIVISGPKWIFMNLHWVIILVTIYRGFELESLPKLRYGKVKTLNGSLRWKSILRKTVYLLTSINVLLQTVLIVRTNLCNSKISKINLIKL